MSRWEWFVFKVVIVLFLSACFAAKVEIQEHLYQAQTGYVWIW